MKRIFISFAKEDINLRDFLRGQSRNENSPFEFVDMSVKEPWDNKWKTNNTKHADGQIWEMKCAKDENIPIIGIYGYDDHSGATVPAECGYIRIMDWTWHNISNWINNL